jgi:spermidine/putrescine transport system substrate-binding protein
MTIRRSPRAGPEGRATRGRHLASQAHAEGTLHFANWSDYFPPDLLKKFEKDTGIHATLDSYDSNETLLAKLKAGGGAYDVVVPSDSFIEIFVKEGLLQKLDKGQLSNLANLKDKFKTSYDPGHDYTVPYLWGTTGYSYDSAKAPGGQFEESWKPFFEPPADFKGKVVALNSIDDL